ncbi:response regulator transcription factor [candidate division KSB1 bacterium]|nr:response regulator transcription factor [candidate division KSB1 bacterium]
MHKILIVDDDLQICQLFGSALKNAGYQVLIATSSIEGLKLALEEHPHIIISDFAMPDQDGSQFCRAVRDHDEIASVHFIVITGNGNDELKTDGLSRLFDDYLEKPVDMPYLVAKVNAVVRRMERVRI